jgi:LysM repeat protein
MGNRKSMVRSTWVRTLVIAAILPILAHCGNQQVRDLEITVGALEHQLQQYQQEAERETTHTVLSLEQLNESTQRHFMDVRESQNRLDNRLAELERSMENIHARLRQTMDFTEESAALTQDLDRTRANFEQRVSSDLQQLSANMRQLSEAMNALQSSSRTQYQDSLQRIQQTEAQLNQRITAVEDNNRQTYERILMELGAEAPVDLPTTQPATPSTDGGITHIVEQGETLSSIAVKYGVEMRRIQQLNGITDPSRIRLGQRLTIPAQ